MSRTLGTKLLVASCVAALATAMLATTSGAAANPYPKTGACDKSKTPVEVGETTVFESPVLTLIDQVDALKASVAAFNKNYSGVGGHCLTLVTCDEQADPNKAEACARKFTGDSKMVATL